MIRYSLPLPHALQSLIINVDRTFQGLEVLFQIPECAYGAWDEPQNYLAQAVALAFLVSHQSRMGFITEVGWLAHIY
jgi:hypothetical protein